MKEERNKETKKEGGRKEERKRERMEERYLHTQERKDFEPQKVKEKP